MSFVELSHTLLKEMQLTIINGEAVVRIQKRLSALIGIYEQNIPERYRDLLANASFSGTSYNERISWTTEVFSEQPKRLSELSGEQREHYEQILADAMRTYSSVFSKAQNDVRELIVAAITYHSPDTIFCANDRCVITEWGMSPHNLANLVQLPYSMELSSDGACNIAKSTETANVNVDDVKDKKSNEESTDVSAGGPGGENTYVHQFDNSDKGTSTSASHKVASAESTGNRTSRNSSKDKKEKKSSFFAQFKNRLKYLIISLLFFVLLLLFAGILVNACSSPMHSVKPVTPGITEDDVVLSDDSLSYVVANRLLLILTEPGADIEEFVGDFRKIYSDEDVYILSNPDSIIRRITLTIPESEREQMREKLPRQFKKYGLEVIPETMYNTSVIPNDPAISDGDKRWYFDMCNVFDAWDVTMGSEDIVVAVIDDGFDLSHSEIQGKIVNPYNAVLHNRNVFPSKSGHGMHVAATAVGLANNGTGICGVAPECKLMPIQVGDENGMMASSAVLDAVIYAINQGADVVNMSLGMSFGPFVQFVPQYMQRNIRANAFLQEERVWKHLFNIAKERNVTFVLAGGNENILIGLDPMTRSSNTIRVSAVQPSKYKADFSNYGDYSTVSAPGVNIYNAVPNERYTFMNGTSMASPIVAGGCALLKSVDKNLTTAELTQILRKTGIPSPSDVGPIVNFAHALNGEDELPVVDECEEINKRYNELIAEIEKLKREHPECIHTPDTMTIPEDVTLDLLQGRWKSTTSLYNEQEEEVVLYFTFNGTSQARLDAVEPDGSVFSARLNVVVSNNEIHIDQIEPASNPNNPVSYSMYRFILKPDKNRHAEGFGENKSNKANTINFKLIRI